MMRRWKGVAMAGTAGVLAIFLAGAVMTRNLALDTTYSSLRLFNEVLSLIQKSYVDEVNSSSLMEGAYEGMLSGLDPFSEYFTAAEYAAAQAAGKKPSPGSSADAGLRLARREGSVLVVSVKPGSDAESRGITAGDLVRRLGGDSARELHLFEVEGRLKGDAGSSVAIQVARREEPRKIETDITRRVNSLPGPALEVVDAAEGIAVLKIMQFEPGASQAIAGLLERAQKQKIRRLLVDLRGNAWGTMDEAARAAGLFVGDTVVSRLKSKTEVVRELRGRARGVYTGSVALLVNASTAESAELFAAALQDLRGAKVIGENTFGVGAEQEFIALNNGDWLKLSTRKYLSPSGTAWHGTGLKPTDPIPQGQDGERASRLQRQLDKALDVLRAVPDPSTAAMRAPGEEPVAN
ncbi:MAG: S41 family peptidase [Candidatus Polarisedimenticolia bacterium]